MLRVCLSDVRRSGENRRKHEVCVFKEPSSQDLACRVAAGTVARARAASPPAGRREVWEEVTMPMGDSWGSMMERTGGVRKRSVQERAQLRSWERELTFSLGRGRQARTGCEMFASAYLSPALSSTTSTAAEAIVPSSPSAARAGVDCCCCCHWLRLADGHPGMARPEPRSSRRRHGRQQRRVAACSQRRCVVLCMGNDEAWL